MNLKTTKKRYAVVGQGTKGQLRFDLVSRQWVAGEVPELSLVEALGIAEDQRIRGFGDAQVIDLDIEDGLAEIAAKVREGMNDAVSFADKPVDWVIGQEGYQHCSNVLNAINEAKEAALMAFIVSM